jgi:hypothetical protein
VKQFTRFVDTPARRKLLAGFWANIAVAWFIAAFISEGVWLTRLVYIANILLSLALALILEE